MFTCIGKRKGEHGSIVKCTNQSETPTRADRPDWGYLCSECLGTRYGRAPLHVEIPDMEKPNAPELEAYELEGVRSGRFEQESEAEELADLRELELDIDGLV
jgi:hypothetical protein